MYIDVCRPRVARPLGVTMGVATEPLHYNARTQQHILNIGSPMLMGPKPFAPLKHICIYIYIYINILRLYLSTHKR